MSRLNAREQRWLAVLLFVLMLAAGWLLLVRPLLGGFANRAERRHELAFEYARDERTIGQLPSIGRAAAAQRLSAARFRLMAPDQPGAAALLKAHVARAVASAGGQLRDMEEVAQSPGTVRLRVQAGLTMGQLAALLADLANGAPVLMVDAMQIDARKDELPNASAQLDTSLDVSAAYSASQPR